jgi:hypothetical protein
VHGQARSRAEVSRFFAGLDLLPPGVVDVTAWRSRRRRTARPALFYPGIGRKPASAPGILS